MEYDFSEDMYSQDSVELLRNAGIDFARHQTDGIRMEDFGELLTTSGLVVDDTVTWLTFHRYALLLFSRQRSIYAS